MENTIKQLITEENPETGLLTEESDLPGGKGKKLVIKHYGNLISQKPRPEIPWIRLAPDAPYFVTDSGENWTPIGQNDAITWPDFANIFRRKDMKQAEGHLAWLAEHGITCLRFMLEYAQTEHRYFERPVGKFPADMVRLWDDLFALCAKYQLRVLLTPFDTFWMWLRWKHHPYNKKNGGPCSKRSGFLLCPYTLSAIKKRFSFAAERWGGSGVLFAWDLWNEIHPVYANKSTEGFYNYIEEVSLHLRTTEEKLYGRSHLQTVSLYGPVLAGYPQVADDIFRHPSLDFASTHFYDAATINNPKNTVESAVCTGKLVREALQHIKDNRPFFDSEHGPIHAFKDRHKILPEQFDDEYFRHMQWAHFASGAAGGGMRWPNRHPHCLTHGMRRAQKVLSQFSGMFNWKTFRRKNLNEEVSKSLNDPGLAAFACGDEKQAIVWLLRKDTLRKDGTLNPAAKPKDVQLNIPGMEEGEYIVSSRYTGDGGELTERNVFCHGGNLELPVKEVITDLILAIRKIN